ncbi:hypothetical protein Curi_c17500 [Gottschalkia acidurici 9a]|uniref:Uncharacterized protein n=1 Tax=Gottschalkia acidurici (strain ATCC 7906 / DSM 604 / BCRC 14475 / CIP 104303 / KCTC 5404 / NCIMB 10678 / 9a) TaxID=1128398 RepID=K0B107_GOTA9|nr:hypothetical protein [Gottschalkia acidurici]AFS78757.1 hypothetical protein Curi_c17500 [Gottschalkia acidurici 9a]
MNKTKGIKILKNIIFAILIFFIVVVGIILFINLLVRPTAEHKRNISKTNAKIIVDINDKSKTRTPIIRTYKEEEYKKFSKDKIRRIKGVISGKVEGDIPAVHLKGDKDIIYISFIKDEEKIVPDYIPEIEIEIPEDEVSTAPYSTENAKIIKDKLKNEDGKYSYKLKRYRTQYEKYFMHYNIIRIYYEVDGERYISTFGLNATNADDGANFLRTKH